MTSTFADDEVLREFLVESYENLDQLDQDFVALETDPAAKERIAGIFRTIHTIKGTSGFFGFGKLESLTHAGENLLAKLRDGEMTLTADKTSALLAMVDQVRAFLSQIESTGAEGANDCSVIISTLTALSEGSAAPAPEPPPPESVAGVEVWSVHPPAEEPEPEPEPAGAPTPPPPPAEPERVIKGPAVSDSSVRVDVGLLDKLMNLVGELVLARNQVVQFGASIEDSAFISASQRLNLITTELQEGVMKTRMQPIGNVWNKLPRVVRDLSVSCGKQVRVEMVGKETELDRTIIEAIKDPLTHIVRNAVDHGIEAADVRAAHGKPRTGTLMLRAFHEGGQVNIEISDDGGGVNAQAVRRKAIKNGLVTPERAERMTDREVAQLIFVPGFSTAEKVSNVSGRGVGMDVVKTNIEKIGGTVDLASSPNGTTIKIKIPLTLAIVPALVVTSRGHRFAIPQVSLLELVRLEGEQAREGIEFIHGTPIYRLRGNLLPIVHLDHVLGLDTEEAHGEEDVVNIVVVQAGDRTFGLTVDEVRDTEEIVVKPLGKELKSVSAFAGATIMGDGKVALILDVLGVAQSAGAASPPREKNLLEAEAGPSARAEVNGDIERLLLVRVGSGGRMAIPLSTVARLEEFPSSQVEKAGPRSVVQYRGDVLPLIEVSQAVCDEAPELGETLYVVVYSDNGRSIGLVVDEILDIVEESSAKRNAVSRHGILGTMVLQGRVTELIDAHSLITEQDPTFFERSAA